MSVHPVSAARSAYPLQASRPAPVVKHGEFTPKPSRDLLTALQAPALSAQGDLAATQWTSGRPSYEKAATTGAVTTGDKTTTTAQMKVSLKSGAAYTFNSAYSYSYSGQKPAFALSVADSTGKVIKTSTSGSLSLTAAETGKLANGDFTLTLKATPGKGGSAWLNSYTLNAYQQLSSLPSSSGNTAVDAILAGKNYWWHDEGEVAKASATAITPTVNQISGAKTKLYYGFLTGQENYLSKDDKAGFAAMDTDQQSAVGDALSYLSSLINVEFIKDESKANITFGTNQQTSSAGYAKYPNGNGLGASVLMLDKADSKGVATNTGAQLNDHSSYAWYTLIHELGHAMGLKHPGAYNAGGGTTPGPYLPAASDNRGTTVMSYNDAAGSKKLNVSASSNGYTYSSSGISPSSYKVLDIAALQYLYGSNKNTDASDLTVSDSYQSYSAVWAPKGLRVDASATTRSNVFDMRAGYYSSIAIRTADDQIQSVKSSFQDQGTQTDDYQEALARLAGQVQSLHEENVIFNHLRFRCKKCG